MPAGSVVQVVQTTTTSMASTAATTWQDVTGFSAITITPSSTSNKVLITLSAWGIFFNPYGCGI